MKKTDFAKDGENSVSAIQGLQVTERRDLI